MNASWFIPGAVLAALVVSASGCGDASQTNYTAKDVQGAFRAVGIKSHIVFDPSTTTSLLKDLHESVGKDDVLAVVSTPQRTRAGVVDYAVSASVLDSEAAASRRFRWEGVQTVCGEAVGRRENVIVAGDPRYLPEIRAALERLPKRTTVPLLHLKAHCDEH